MVTIHAAAATTRILAAALVGCVFRCASAAELEVDVVDRNDEPISEVAVYLVPLDEQSRQLGAGDPQPAVMEQSDSAFVPHLLVVETGAEVSFPNNDTVSHHVYSFSEAKRFQLDLYRGNTHPPQLFDRPGLVVLGCNIHDSMLGYILVVDTPFSSVTGDGGSARIPDLPEGDYELLVWTPRANPDDLPAAEIVTVTDTGQQSVTLRIDGKLRPPHDSSSGSLSWNAY